MEAAFQRQISTSKEAEKMKGRGKGGNFEREFCKMLSLWWTLGERDDVFWRTAGSGARATVRKRKGKDTHGQYGDVQAVDPIGEPLMRLCTIELKRGYPKATLSQTIEGRGSKVSEFEKFIQQAKDDSLKAGVPYWILVTKRNHREAMIWMPFTLYTYIIGSEINQARPWLKLKLDEIVGAIFGTTLDQFLGLTHPKSLRGGK